jgi:NADPH-dependent 2,4-dienoyl-CoA reductase/sulfur reductase-like enzyme
LYDAARYRLATAGARYQPGVWVKRAQGETQVRAALLTDGAREWTVDCDVLGVGYNLIPALELPRLLDCAITNGVVSVDERQQTSLERIFCAGETTGIGGVDAALVEGQIAGLAAAGANNSPGLMQARARQRAFAQAMEKAFALRPELRQLPEPDTIVCRCEDVNLARVRAHSSLREAKLMTRAGMGACQGRVCGSALQHLCGWAADSVRSPAAAARVGTLAATHTGEES